MREQLLKLKDVPKVLVQKLPHYFQTTKCFKARRCQVQLKFWQRMNGIRRLNCLG